MTDIESVSMQKVLIQKPLYSWDLNTSVSTMHLYSNNILTSAGQ